MMVADQVGLEYGDFVHTFGDVHIYLNHMEQVEEQLGREPRNEPIMEINKDGVGDIFHYNYSDFSLLHYFPYPAIKAEIAV
jgi:thymidylate synthase